MTKLNSKHLDGKYLLKQAEKSGLRVEMAKGDHAKIFAPEGRGYMIVPCRQIGRGLAATVVKWLVAAGATVALVVCLLK